MIKWDRATCNGVDRVTMTVFEIVAPLTSDRQIIQITGATFGARDNVFNGEGVWREFSLTETILAATIGALFNELSLLLCEAGFRHNQRSQDED